MKQQWITSNQAQSTEGVIMHTAAALLSLCKPSLSPSSLSCSLSLSLKALWAEWLICDYWFLENVGGIERERGRGRGGGRGRGRGGGSIQYSEERLAAALASGSLRFRKKKKKKKKPMGAEFGIRQITSIHPSFLLLLPPPLFIPSFYFSSPFFLFLLLLLPLLPPPPPSCPLPPKLSVNIQQKTPERFCNEQEGTEGREKEEREGEMLRKEKQKYLPLLKFINYLDP